MLEVLLRASTSNSAAVLNIFSLVTLIVSVVLSFPHTIGSGTIFWTIVFDNAFGVLPVLV